MEKTKEKELAKIAARVRKEGLSAIYKAKSGHIGGAFSATDILVTLYFDKMNIDAGNPDWEDRDRFVLSKGHCTGAIYPVLALKGFFPVDDLQTFRKIDSYLSGHIEMKHVPGVDMSAGSLGQGLSVACGMALAAKATGEKYRTYAVCGDGEIEEGQIWEAAMAAGHYKLDNLTAFVDNNGLQIDDTCENMMSIYPIDEKFKSFGWHVINIDGHDFQQISDAVDEAKSVKGKPTMIVAKTVKGKGVSFMENNLKWHGTPPSDEEYEKANAELDATLERLGS